ncbi:MAG: hypothetical protein RLZZ338_882 [Cyanobacteriota bacterium]
MTSKISSNNSTHTILLKWGILLKITPLIGLFCLGKWTFHLMKWEIGKFDPQIGSLFATVAFLLAFMLSAAMLDYRLSEEMPNSIAIAVETIQDTNLMIAARHSEYNSIPLTEGLVDILSTTLICLQEYKSFISVEDVVTSLNPLLVPLSKFCEAPLMARIQGEQGKIRFTIAQIKRIRDTDFLPASYALQYILLIISTMTLLVTHTDEFFTNLIVSGFLFTAITYVILLIHDIDNPFEFNGRSSVDVTLLPLEKSYQRLRAGLL